MVPASRVGREPPVRVSVRRSLAASSFTALTLKSIHAFRSCVITPGSASPAVLLAAFGEALEATAPGAPVAPPRAPSRPASGSLLSTHTLRRSESRTRLWYTLRRKLQSPAGKLGDMIFCVLIISLNALKLSTVHVNTPLIGGDADADRASSTDASALCRRWSLGRSSRRNAHDSLSTATSARIVKAPSLPLVHARSAARSAKSHQPWDLRREEKRCQLSRATRLRDGCVGGAPSTRDVSGLGRALSSYATKHSQFPLRGFASAGAVTSRYAGDVPREGLGVPARVQQEPDVVPRRRGGTPSTPGAASPRRRRRPRSRRRSPRSSTRTSPRARSAGARRPPQAGARRRLARVAAPETARGRARRGDRAPSPRRRRGWTWRPRRASRARRAEPATARGRDVAREAERGRAERSRPARERQCAAGPARARREREAADSAEPAFHTRVVRRAGAPRRVLRRTSSRQIFSESSSRPSARAPATRRRVRPRAARAPRAHRDGRGPDRVAERAPVDPGGGPSLARRARSCRREQWAEISRASSVARARSPPCVPACRR